MYFWPLKNCDHWLDRIHISRGGSLVITDDLVDFGRDPFKKRWLTAAIFLLGGWVWSTDRKIFSGMIFMLLFSM